MLFAENTVMGEKYFVQILALIKNPYYVCIGNYVATLTNTFESNLR